MSACKCWGIQCIDGYVLEGEDLVSLVPRDLAAAGDHEAAMHHGSPHDFLCGQRDMTCPGGAGRGRRGRRDWRNDGRDNRHLENLLRFAVVLPVPGGVRWTPATPRVTRFRGSSNLLTAFARGRNLIQSPRLFRFSSASSSALSLCLYGEKTNSQLWIYKVIRGKMWVRIVPFWLDLRVCNRLIPAFPAGPNPIVGGGGGQNLESSVVST